MKEVLTKFIQSKDKWKEIIVDYWNINGAECEVVYYTDYSRHYKEQKIINIWDMLVFMKLI